MSEPDELARDLDDADHEYRNDVELCGLTEAAARMVRHYRAAVTRHQATHAALRNQLAETQAALELERDLKFAELTTADLHGVTTIDHLMRLHEATHAQIQRLGHPLP